MLRTSQLYLAKKQQQQCNGNIVSISRFLHGASWRTRCKKLKCKLTEDSSSGTSADNPNPNKNNLTVYYASHDVIFLVVGLSISSSA